MKNLKMDNEGSALIAFPIVFILLMSLVVGFVCYSYTYYQKIVMDKAVREGARTFRVTERLDKAIAATQEELQIGLVRDVIVTHDDHRIIATKRRGFYIPLANRYVFQLVSSFEFQAEDELEYYWEDHYR